MSKVVVLGKGGQLSNALAQVYGDATFLAVEDLDISNAAQVEAFDWKDFDVIINAAAYTAVDLAETAEGRKIAWAVNASAVANLVTQANKAGAIFIHISSDYVFDGTLDNHLEEEPYSPLGVYGQTKAAGDIAASLAEKHYLLRTSWVIGEGKNFVLTMKQLAEKGVKPSVVNDQIGRLTFTKDITSAIKFLLETNAPYGTYNITNEGQPVSWAQIAKQVFVLCGKSEADVSEVSTQEYYKDKQEIAPRPKFSTLDLTKIEKIGFKPRNWDDALKEYLR